VSDIDVNREFSSFGIKALVLGILEIFLFIFTLFFYFSLFWGPFVIILLIVIMVFRILAARSLTKANSVFNNLRLKQCPSKIIISIIIFLIGTYCYFNGRNGLARLNALEISDPDRILFYLVFMISGFILIFVSGFIEHQAWGRLYIFFEQNYSTFPPSIGNSGSSGANILKIGGIFNITIVLLFVGSILRIIGFFKLVSLRKLKGEPPITALVPVAQRAPATRPPLAPATSEHNNRFCSNCGSAVKGTENYCAGCGSKL